MKKHFLTGLVLILPVAITLFIAELLINFFTTPFLCIIEWWLIKLGGNPLHSPALFEWLSRLLIFLILMIFIITIGFLGRFSLTHAFFQMNARFFYKIPLASKIYQAVQDIVYNIFCTKKPSFSKVVLVPFPNAKSKAVGFITREELPTDNPEKKQFISVFIPGTPNPMMGFMLMFRKEHITYTDLSIEEAIKFIASCGLIHNNRDKI